MVVPEFQCCQDNGIAKHKQTVFLHSQYLFAAGKAPVSVHLTLTPLVATEKNHSHYESFHCNVIIISVFLFYTLTLQVPRVTNIDFLLTTLSEHQE